MGEEQVVIVTGGSNGMGKYMAKHFVETGASVVVTGRNEERLQSVKEEFSSFKGTIEVFQMDVREQDHVKAMVEFTVEKFGKIDVLNQ